MAQVLLPPVTKLQNMLIKHSESSWWTIFQTYFLLKKYSKMFNIAMSSSATKDKKWHKHFWEWSQGDWRNKKHFWIRVLLIRKHLNCFETFLWEKWTSENPQIEQNIFVGWVISITALLKLKAPLMIFYCGVYLQLWGIGFVELCNCSVIVHSRYLVTTISLQSLMIL